MFISVEAFSTSCPRDYDIGVMNEGAEVVFSGKLKSKSKSFFLRKYKYTFEIESVIKGNPSNEIIIWSNSEADCGMNLDFDVRYVIFAYPRENKLWTGRGSLWSIDGQHQKYTDKFNKFYKLDSEKEIEVKGNVNVHEASHKSD